MALGALPMYAKNLAKSLGYGLVEASASYSPTIHDYITSNMDIIDDIKESLAGKPNLLNQSEEDNFFRSRFELAKTMKDNLVNAIKTGDFYSMGAGFDDDFDFDDFNFDDDDFNFDDDDDLGDIESGDDDEFGLDDLSDDLYDMGDIVAKKVGIATAKSAEYIVTANHQVAKVNASLMQQNHSDLMGILSNISSGVAALVKLNEPMLQHYSESSSFYAQSLDNQSKIIGLLEEIKGGVIPATNEKNRKESNFDRMLSAGGGVYLKEYFKSIKENFKEVLSEVTLGGSDFLFNDDTTKTIAASLPQLIAQGIGNKLLPKVMKESMKVFEDQFSNFAKAAMYKLSASTNGDIDYDNPTSMITSIFGKIFGINDKFTSRHDNSSYNRGAIAFDGETKKAITEVIPSQLERLISSITGDEERRYNYETGKFMKVSEIYKEYKDIIPRITNRVGYSLMDYLEERYSRGSNRFKNIKLTLKELSKQMALKHMALDPADDPETVATLLSMEEYLPYITDIYKAVIDLTKAGDFKAVNEFNADLLDARSRITKEFEKNNQLYNSLYDDSISLDMNTGLYTRVNYRGGGYVPTNASSIINNVGGNVQFESSSTDKLIQLEEEKEAKDKAKQDESKKLHDSMMKGITNALGFAKDGRGKSTLAAMYDAITTKPAQFAANIMLGTAGNLNSLLYGTKAHMNEFDKKVEQDGLITTIVDEAKNMFSSLSEWMKENVLDPLGEAFSGEGGILKSIADFFGFNEDGVKKYFGEFKEKFSGGMKNKLSALKQFFIGSVNDVFSTSGSINPDRSMAATGGQVTKTGMVAVSEGELIIPSEYNPFYNKKTDKNKQKRDELNAFKNFYGFYDNGGTVGDGGYAKIKSSRYNPYSIVGNYLDKRDMKKEAELYKERRDLRNHRLNRFRFDQTGKVLDMGNEDPFLNDPSIANTVRESATFLKSSVLDLGHAVEFLAQETLNLGNTGQIKDVLKTTFDEMKVPDNAAGAVLGGLGGVGLSILGGPFGILTGLALGAGTGLIASSQSLQEKLLGTEDKDGLLDPRIGKFLKEKFPNIAQHATIGGTIGFFGGATIPGMLLGGTIGYLRKNEQFMEYLFGTPEFDDGLISKEVQRNMKERGSRMGAGALAGFLFGGPLGIVGNMMLGSAIGYASGSEKFQDYLFGTAERDKDGNLVTDKNGRVKRLEDGLLTRISKRTIMPTVNLLKTTGEYLLFQTKSLFRSMHKIFDSVFKYPATLLGRKFKRFVDMFSFTKVLAKVIASPLMLPGWFGTGLKKHMIRKGQLNSMSAMERLQYRAENGMNIRTATGLTAGGFGDYTFGFDTMLAKASRDELLELKDNLNYLKDPGKNARKLIRGQVRQANGLARAFPDLSYGTAKLMVNSIKSGDRSEYERVLKRAQRDLSPEDYQDFYNNYTNLFEENSIQQKNLEAGNNISDEGLGKLGKQFGVRKLQAHLEKYQDLVNTELRAKKDNPAKSELQEQWKSTLKYRSRIASLLSIIANATTGGLYKLNKSDIEYSDIELPDSVNKYLDEMRARDGKLKEKTGAQKVMANHEEVANHIVDMINNPNGVSYDDIYDLMASGDGSSDAVVRAVSKQLKHADTVRELQDNRSSNATDESYNNSKVGDVHIQNVDGYLLKYKTDSKGNTKPDMSDTVTREYFDKQKELQDVDKENKKTQSIFMRALGAIWDGTKSKSTRAKNFFENMIDSVVGFMSNSALGIGTLFALPHIAKFLTSEPVKKTIGEFIGGFKPIVSTIFRETVPAIIDTFKNIGPEIVNVTKGAVSSLTSLINELLKIVGVNIHTEDKYVTDDNGNKIKVTEDANGNLIDENGNIHGKPEDNNVETFEYGHLKSIKGTLFNSIPRYISHGTQVKSIEKVPFIGKWFKNIHSVMKKIPKPVNNISNVNNVVEETAKMATKSFLESAKDGYSKTSSGIYLPNNIADLNTSASTASEVITDAKESSMIAKFCKAAANKFIELLDTIPKFKEFRTGVMKFVGNFNEIFSRITNTIRSRYGSSFISGVIGALANISNILFIMHDFAFTVDHPYHVLSIAQPIGDKLSEVHKFFALVFAIFSNVIVRSFPVIGALASLLGDGFNVHHITHGVLYTMNLAGGVIDRITGGSFTAIENARKKSETLKDDYNLKHGTLYAQNDFYDAIDKGYIRKGDDGEDYFKYTKGYRNSQMNINYFDYDPNKPNNSSYMWDYDPYHDTGSGSGIMNSISNMSGVVSQNSNKKYGGSDLSDIGCGPAAATNVLNSIGVGGNMNDAVDYARKYGYERYGGTESGFFPSYLASKGVSTVTTNGPINPNAPSVLLGVDPNNKSKDKSPFGPRPHFVVANGIKDGKVNILDSETGKSKKYPLSILNKVTKATSVVGAGPGINIFGNALKYGAPLATKFLSGITNDSSNNSGYENDQTKLFDINWIIHWDLTSYSPVDVDALVAFYERQKKKYHRPAKEIVQAFVEASYAVGIDPRYLLAHAMIESGWFQSPISRDKNNYFGIAAYDSSPYSSAYTYSSNLSKAIADQAAWIGRNYIFDGQRSLYTMRHDPTGRGHNYATDEQWHYKIAATMRDLNRITPNTKVKYYDVSLNMVDKNSLYTTTGDIKQTYQAHLNNGRGNRDELSNSNESNNLFGGYYSNTGDNTLIGDLTNVAKAFIGTMDPDGNLSRLGNYVTGGLFGSSDASNNIDPPINNDDIRHGNVDLYEPKNIVSNIFSSLFNGNRITGKREDFAAKAEHYANQPVVYKSGGRSLETGVDCSGFVGAIAKDYIPGMPPIGSTSQLSWFRKGNGTVIDDRSKLQRGDIIYFRGTGGNYDTETSHTAIMLDNKRFSHAPNEDVGTEIGSLDNSYWSKHYYTAVRPNIGGGSGLLSDKYDTNITNIVRSNSKAKNPTIVNNNIDNTKSELLLSRILMVLEKLETGSNDKMSKIIELIISYYKNRGVDVSKMITSGTNKSMPTIIDDSETDLTHNDIVLLEKISALAKGF